MPKKKKKNQYTEIQQAQDVLVTLAHNMQDPTHSTGQLTNVRTRLSLLTLCLLCETVVAVGSFEKALENISKAINSAVLDLNQIREEENK